uniref:Exocyst complex component SEC5 n=1 Tax=Nelumbo nucifera TaxID=4432 RepID=A0A822XFH7_NELNU|nr:TPA_asm: hypothetical protein HUJ06_019239 [Nelumbo nucifera]
MIENLRNASTKSGDIFEQLQEIQESVRFALMNCFLNFSGFLELVGSELTENKSDHETSGLENGFAHEPDGKEQGLHPGNITGDPHQKLLIVLSNIGYCKDELIYELYSKYRHIWMQSRCVLLPFYFSEQLFFLFFLFVMFLLVSNFFFYS